MDCVIERGCGLDVHRRTVDRVCACAGTEGERDQHVRTFGTAAADRLALRDWLIAQSVTHVAESTGVYWKPDL